MKQIDNTLRSQTFMLTMKALEIISKALDILSVDEEEDCTVQPEQSEQSPVQPAQPVPSPAEPVQSPAELVPSPAEPVQSPAELVPSPAEPVPSPAEPVQQDLQFLQSRCVEVAPPVPPLAAGQGVPGPWPQPGPRKLHRAHAHRGAGHRQKHLLQDALAPPRHVGMPFPLSIK